jgi:hypothetical protein
MIGHVPSLIVFFSRCQVPVDSGESVPPLRKYARDLSADVIKEDGSESCLATQHAVEKAVDTLSAFSGCILVDKSRPSTAEATGSNSETDVETARQRTVVHRAVLNAAVIYKLASSTRRLRSKEGSSAPSTQLDDYPFSSGVKRKAHNDLLQEFWGPVLVVVSADDLVAWEEGLAPLCHAAGLELLPYYGTQDDRDVLLSYTTLQRSVTASMSHISLTAATSLYGQGIPSGNSLYTERSPFHVVLMPFDVFVTDSNSFKDVIWELQIWDQPWGYFLSNTVFEAPLPAHTRARGKSALSGEKNTFKAHFFRYHLLANAVQTARNRIISCEAIREGPDHPLPDPIEILFVIYPPALGLSWSVASGDLTAAKAAAWIAETEQKTLLNSVRPVFITLFNDFERATYTCMQVFSLCNGTNLASLVEREWQKIATAFTIVCDDALVERMLLALSKTEGGGGGGDGRAAVAPVLELLPSLEWAGTTLAIALPDEEPVPAHPTGSKVFGLNTLSGASAEESPLPPCLAQLQVTLVVHNKVRRKTTEAAVAVTQRRNYKRKTPAAKVEAPRLLLPPSAADASPSPRPSLPAAEKRVENDDSGSEDNKEGIDLSMLSETMRYHISPQDGMNDGEAAEEDSGGSEMEGSTSSISPLP